MTQQLVIKPHGIVSQPNKLGMIPQGALQFADQCYMRQPGMIENANTYSFVSPSLGTLGSNAAFVTQVDSQFALVTYTSGNALSTFIDTNSVSFSGLQNFMDESHTIQTIDSTGRLSTTINRSRVLFTAVNGTYVRDLPTHGAMRSAGLPQPVLSTVLADVSAAGTALPAFTHAAYTCVYVRRFSDGYEMVSVPAFAQDADNSVSTAHNVSITVSIGTQVSFGYIVAGDIIQIYRTKSQTANNTTSTWTNTGSDYLLSIEYTITSADIISGTVSLKDSVPDASLGEALYTNAGVKTQDGIALPSPTCKAMCTFKGYTFFFNRTDPPKFSFRIPVWWGNFGDHTGMDASSRKNGIGSRIVVGNTTSGNATLSSVPAGDLIGIVPGQRVPFGGLNFPFNSKVLSVGASSITFDQNATATSTGTSITIGDVFELNGTVSFLLNSTWLGQQQANGLNTSALLCANCLNFVVAQSPVSGIASFPVPAQPIDVFYIRLCDQLSTITVRATNGANYVPQLPEISATVKTVSSLQVKNGLSWSEQNQPENVPPLNTAFCGSGEIYAAYATRDAIWIFASDGLWRLSGTGGSAGPEGFDWRIDPVDSTLIIAGPQAGCVLRDMVFAYTNRGLVQISSDGTVKELTLGRLDDRLPGPPWSTPSYTAANAIFLIADETNDEIWMKENGTPGNRVWIYNYINDAFTNDFIGNTDLAGNAPIHGCYSRFKQAVIFLDPTSATLVTPNNSATRKKLDAKFQALLGDDPFTTRMWQQCEASFYVPDHAYINQSFTLYANGDTVAPFTNTLGFNCGHRALTSINAPQTDAKFGRVSWSIPRSAPAIAYTFAPEIYGGGSSVVYFQGLAVKFIDLTEQRADR